jgi:hypothetical protein
MKMALFVEEGTKQIVLTPDNETESAILALLLATPDPSLTIKRGQFYKNQAGYTREGSDKVSTILVLS